MEGQAKDLMSQLLTNPHSGGRGVDLVRGARWAPTTSPPTAYYPQGETPDLPRSRCWGLQGGVDLRGHSSSQVGPTHIALGHCESSHGALPLGMFYLPPPEAFPLFNILHNIELGLELYLAEACNISISLWQALQYNRPVSSVMDIVCVMPIISHGTQPMCIDIHK